MPLTDAISIRLVTSVAAFHCCLLRRAIYFIVENKLMMMMMKLCAVFLCSLIFLL